MRIFSYFLIFLFALSSCKTSHTGVSIQWSDNLTLPPTLKDGGNPGLAGAFSGVYRSYLIVAGGANFPDGLPWQGGKKIYHNEAYVFHEENGTWKSMDVFLLKDTLAYGTAIPLNSGIVCLGGENANGIFSNSVILKFDSSDNQIISTPFVPLPLPLTNLSAVEVSGKIYIAGGAGPDSVSNKFFVLDLKNQDGGWKELTNLPKPVTNFVMVPLGNQIFIVGGRCQKKDGISDLYDSVFAYDISTNRWEEKHALPYALSAGTGIALNDHQILLFGGDRGETFHKTEILIQKIKTEKDSAGKNSLISEKNKLQENHPGFSKAVLLYDLKKNNWEMIGDIPFPTPATTLAVKFKNEVIIPSGEIRAGIRTPHILIGKITTP
ncbi:MAG: hypothetical protein J0H55_13760 [Chitinophagaceae bacterium]|nr:hypothetical protein [Chitinophagaceae bacterium]